MRLWILKFVHYTYVDVHNALQNVSFQEFQKFAKHFISCLYIQCLVQGNMKEVDVINSLYPILKIFNCNSSHSNKKESNRVFQLPLGTSNCKLKNINKRDPTSVVVNTYQIDASIESSVLMRLIIVSIK